MTKKESTKPEVEILEDNDEIITLYDDDNN